MTNQENEFEDRTPWEEFLYNFTWKSIKNLYFTGGYDEH